MGVVAAVAITTIITTTAATGLKIIRSGGAIKEDMGFAGCHRPKY